MCFCFWFLLSTCFFVFVVLFWFGLGWVGLGWCDMLILLCGFKQGRSVKWSEVE